MAGGHLNRRVPQLRVAGKNTVLFDDGIAEDVFFAAIQVPKVAKSYCNVPGLFGCVPWQSHHYVGVDCADVLMAAACLYSTTGAQGISLLLFLENSEYVNLIFD